MANIEILDLTSKVEGPNGLQPEASAAVSSDKEEGHVTPGDRSDGQLCSSSPASLSPGSVSTPLRTTPVNGLASGQGNPPTLSMPHPKKFSSVNINKKFLETTSAASPSGQALSASSTAKTGSSTQKPVLQTAPSHSRLVTTKLTATLQASTTTGPGWSRPSSTVSSTAPTPLSATNSKPPAFPTPTGVGNVAPQPPPAGKVIQPQPRGADVLSGSIKKDSTGKPAWGSAKATASIVGNVDEVTNDFPTAAEVAQGRTTKLLEKKHAAEVAAAQKQAVAAEEDTFRGVHLNPNAHHWDEMEEDDDNFLGGVIEFGDGRQYKIQPTDATQQSSPPRELPELAADGEVDSIKHSGKPDQPVRKEDRFADDFDRSWPRSRTTAAFPHQPREQYPTGPASSTSSQSLHSPQESSRVLFNERSNRLEPYSNTHPPHRQVGPGPTPFLSRRGSRSDYVVSPTESRNGRDAPPHPHTQGVQLLQKTSGPTDFRSDGPPRGDNLGHSLASPLDGSRFHDRELHRHESVPPPHALGRTPSQSYQSRPKDHNNSPGMPVISPVGSGPSDGWPRRLSTMGPPPPPLPSSNEFSKISGRQLPPHLSNMGPPPPPLRAAPVLEVKSPVLATNASEPPSTSLSPGRPPPVSPVSSLASLSPMMSDKLLQSTMPLVDVEEVRKAAMHSAAERARLRRQQEEEEREKQKERAMKKAAELEEKMKAPEAKSPLQSDVHAQVTEDQAVEFIEEAIKEARSPQETTTDLRAPPEPTPSSSQPVSAVRSPSVRTPSLKGVPRSAPARRSSFLGSDATSPAVEADSWRSKTMLRSPSVPSISPVTFSLPPHPPLLAEVESLARTDEDLEVVDFSELGKLVGVEVPPVPSEKQEPIGSDGPSSRPSRAVATDFFDDHAHATRNDEGSWRRKPPAIYNDPPTDSDSTVPGHPKERLRVQIVSPETFRGPSQAVTSPRARPVDDPSRSHPAYLAHGSQRSPVTPSYREPPMSVLDDAISRIKGALDGMHPKPEAPKAAKWVPPALRPRSEAADHGPPTEVFDVTISEPPRDPSPAWGQFTVRLPVVSRSLEPISKKQLNALRTPSYVRGDIFSWEPPVEGINRREFNINDILFRTPGIRGRIRYSVSLPRTRSATLDSIVEEGSGPVVHLPPNPIGSRSSNNTGAPSNARPTDSSNWRRAPGVIPSRTPSSSKAAHIADVPPAFALDTVSRSPPPEAPSSIPVPASLPKGETTPSNSPTGASAKLRSPSKMPAGSDVAFYRDSRGDTAAQAKSTVSFIVTSELEDALPSERDNVSSPKASAHQVQDTSKSSIPMLPQSKSEPKRTITPPQSWIMSPPAFSLKDSPARVPDPEHLKAVWSQASDKAELPSVNSLEAIADDLTAVPFTLQDVKSEDGETPPPSGSGPPSRMSLHDVTRAFQQVPSSSNSSHRNSQPSQVTSPTSTSAPRPPTFAYAPPPSTNLRPAYPSYPSPMLSHSPSPTVMYPPHMATSPVPRPMMLNGSSPQYSQPMWMPVQGPPGQNPGQMMRPVPSPYPAQLMSYPSPGGAMPMYGPPPPNMQGAPSQQPNGVPGRSANMPMMSPVMQPAHPSHPMYANSPVLMHSHAMLPLLPGGYPGAAQANRGQLRNGYEHTNAASPSMSHPHPHPPQHPPYPAGPPSNTFSRPTW
ncbi:hypothetical protein B0H21DRAFT_691534 [Amylocystis lapponica]|nr:hypothetical protein B0H21DRAFT_691534 [Amylocystis lapponica]